MIPDTIPNRNSLYRKKIDNELVVDAGGKGEYTTTATAIAAAVADGASLGPETAEVKATSGLIDVDQAAENETFTLTVDSVEHVYTAGAGAWTGTSLAAEINADIGSGGTGAVLAVATSATRVDVTCVTATTITAGSNAGLSSVADTAGVAYVAPRKLVIVVKMPGATDDGTRDATGAVQVIDYLTLNQFGRAKKSQDTTLKLTYCDEGRGADPLWVTEGGTGVTYSEDTTNNVLGASTGALNISSTNADGKATLSFAATDFSDYDYVTMGFYAVDPATITSVTYEFFTSVDTSVYRRYQFLSADIEAGFNRFTVCKDDLDAISVDGGTFLWSAVIRVRVWVNQASGTASVTFNDISFIKSPLPRGVAVLCFDDVRVSHSTIARPMMDVYGYPGVAFTIGDELTASYITLLRDLQQSGWDVGNHSMTHNSLAGLTAAELATEMTQEKAVLATNGFPQWDILAYPGGAFDADVKTYLRANGYRIARGTGKGHEAWPFATPYDLRSTIVGEFDAVTPDTLAILQAHVDFCVDHKSVWIATFHAFGTAGEQTISEATFAALMEYIAASDVDVMTFSQLLGDDVPSLPAAVGYPAYEGTVSVVVPANNTYVGGFVEVPIPRGILRGFMIEAGTPGGTASGGTKTFDYAMGTAANAGINLGTAAEFDVMILAGAKTAASIHGDQAGDNAPAYFVLESGGAYIAAGTHVHFNYIGKANTVTGVTQTVTMAVKIWAFVDELAAAAPA